VTAVGRGTSTRRPGRPRAEGLGERVVAATAALLLESPDGSTPTVTQIVRRSGVSRAAIYRRWQAREQIIAEALDSVRDNTPLTVTGDLEADLLDAYRPPADGDDRFDQLVRKRLVLALGDSSLQREYWTAHVSRRRRGMVEAVRRAIEAGTVRPDVDVDAAIDLVAGVYYYQVVVRGGSLRDAEVRDRVRAAIRIACRGLAVTSP